MKVTSDHITFYKDLTMMHMENSQVSSTIEGSFSNLSKKG